MGLGSSAGNRTTSKVEAEASGSPPTGRVGGVVGGCGVVGFIGMFLTLVAKTAKTPFVNEPSCAETPVFTAT